MEALGPMSQAQGFGFRASDSRSVGGQVPTSCQHPELTADAEHRRCMSILGSLFEAPQFSTHHAFS